MQMVDTTANTLEVTFLATTKARSGKTKTKSVSSGNIEDPGIQTIFHTVTYNPVT